jgi:hypothetical protein
MAPPNWEMDSELQFRMVGIRALQQLAAPGFEHLKTKVMWVVQGGCFLIFQ